MSLQPPPENASGHQPSATPPPPPTGLGRRAFLAGAGVVGAGIAGTVLAPPANAAALAPATLAPPANAAALAPAALAPAGPAGNSPARRRRWDPDTESDRFTVAVLPDTQYLFDDASIHQVPLQATVNHVLDAQGQENIVFLAHLGDLTQNGLDHEFAAISAAMEPLDRAGAAYSTLAGNHDVRGDDTRGRTPYLDAFGPQRFRRSPSFLEASPGGYNTAHSFRAAGRDWLLLAMDWRPSPAGIAWAKEVLARRPDAPAILTIHELVGSDDSGAAGFSDQGEHIWSELVNGCDQIFLTINGHFWPSGRVTRRNAAGHDVHLHITNYQQRYYGGAGMIRLYHFDLDRNVIDVETISPWILGQRDPNELAAAEIELSGDTDRFTESIDFAARFAGFAPTPVRPVRPAEKLLIPGTLAYWRFDVVEGERVPDVSRHGNDLHLVHRNGSRPDAITFTGDHHPDQPAHSSAEFRGGKQAGAYLQTGPSAPLNREQFRTGYTVETFFKLPADWADGSHDWSALFSRWGTAREAGMTGQFPDEPVVTLSLSGSREIQWNAYPVTSKTSVTNWSHEIPMDRWWHVAIVNDGRHTVMYVDGCPIVRNPSTIATGLTTLHKPWMLGGYSYGTELGQIHYGSIGDTRIVGRALRPHDFLIS